MGNDRTSNILYGLSVIGGIMFGIGSAYILISEIVWHGTEMVPIDRVLMAVGSVLGSIGYLGIYRDIGSYIPIIPFIFPNLYQIIGMPLSPFLHLGYFTPAYLVIWTIMFIALVFGGYSFYLTRDRIGGFAVFAATLSVIWAFLRIVVAYGIAVTEDLLLYQLRSGAESIIVAVAVIYFILAMRSRGPITPDTS